MDTNTQRAAQLATELERIEAEINALSADINEGDTDRAHLSETAWSAGDKVAEARKRLLAVVRG